MNELYYHYEGGLLRVVGRSTHIRGYASLFNIIDISRFLIYYLYIYTCSEYLLRYITPHVCFSLFYSDSSRVRE
jgi:hypothetical protein